MAEQRNISGSNKHMVTMPDGCGDESSANEVINLGVTNVGGKPFEGLKNSSMGNRNVLYISQIEDINNSIQNEAVGFQGVSLEEHCGTTKTPAECTLIGTAEVVQNEAGTAEVRKVNKPIDPLTFYQQQMMLNHQMMIQQQQTVNSLIGKVDSLSKLVGQKDSANLTIKELPKNSVTRVRSHTLARPHDISSDSSDEEQSEEEAVVDSELESVYSEHNTNDNAQIPEPRNEKQDDNTQANNNMKLLQEMGQEFEKQEAVSSKVDDTLAKVVDSGIRSKIDRSIAKEISQKYQRPENCQSLKVPKLNKELWATAAINKFTKEQDKMLQGTQKYLNQGLIPLVQLMDNLLNDNTADKHFKLARDSFQLLAYAHRDISNVRRQLLKSSVAEKYKQLCNDSTPLTDNLLGEELDKQVKTLDDMRKVGKDISKYKGEKRKFKGNDYERAKKYQKHTYGQQGYKTKDRYENSFLDRKARFHKPGSHKFNNKKVHKQ